MGTEVNCDTKRCRYQISKECTRGEIEVINGICVTIVVDDD
ncbi:hypothetical protein LCGC14_2830820 [marine sediment metagenome]|uniref:DUF1540 domain-containing protein n=1 Tax=marine sediment metagenome TaxID=412755 RepID=A0A0F9B523_9ZZZZ